MSYEEYYYELTEGKYSKQYWRIESVRRALEKLDSLLENEFEKYYLIHSKFFRLYISLQFKNLHSFKQEINTSRAIDHFVDSIKR